MKLFVGFLALVAATPAFAQDVIAAEEALFSEKGVTVGDIAESGVRPFAPEAIAYELTVSDGWEEIDPDDIQAATLWICTQSGGVNVAPGQLYCTTEWVPATCEEVGYVSNDIQQSGDWLYGCVDDAAGSGV